MSSLKASSRWMECLSLEARRFVARTRLRDRRSAEKTVAALSNIPTMLATVLLLAAAMTSLVMARVLSVAAAMVLLVVVVIAVGTGGKRWM